jgi:hypothetical protein
MAYVLAGHGKALWGTLRDTQQEDGHENGTQDNDWRSSKGVLDYVQQYNVHAKS